MNGGESVSTNLIKGQKIDLTKGNPDLSKIQIGLGWDPMKFKSLDIDSSAVLLDQNGKLARPDHLVYFGRKSSPCRSVIHSGDNLTGHGAGDDEVIKVDLNKVPLEVHRIVFIVNIFRFLGFGRKKDFSMVKNAYIRVLNTTSMAEMTRFNLTEDYQGMSSIRVGEVYRHNDEWKFGALGIGSEVTSIQKLIADYQ